MELIETDLPGVRLLVPPRFGDARGWLSETWNSRTLAALGIDTAFVQDNESLSVAEGTLRGLHYQAPPHAQAKLVRCVAGSILDVVVDARRGGPAFGRAVCHELSAENGRQVFVPEGCLHGFLTLEPGCRVAYKCSDHFAPEASGAVHWDSVGLDWGGAAPAILSDKDAAAPAFADWATPFVWSGS